jgi:hypothetical protein
MSGFPVPIKNRNVNRPSEIQRPMVSRNEREFHRKVAASSFNGAWEYLDGPRGSENDLVMLNLVHASRYHWGLVGNPRNFAIGDWQISRAYAAMGEGELALRYANSALECCMANSINDMMHTAFEGVARALAAKGDSEKARVYLDKARTHLSSLKMGAEDRKLYLTQIEETQKMLRTKGRTKRGNS